MNDKSYNGPERRKYFRYNVIYAPKQARLKIGDQHFQVLDYSEGGLRFTKQKNFKSDRQIKATLVHADGRSEDIVGEIVWQTDKEIGLKFTD